MISDPQRRAEFLRTLRHRIETVLASGGEPITDASVRQAADDLGLDPAALVHRANAVRSIQRLQERIAALPDQATITAMIKSDNPATKKQGRDHEEFGQHWRHLILEHKRRYTDMW